MVNPVVRGCGHSCNPCVVVDHGLTTGLFVGNHGPQPQTTLESRLHLCPFVGVVTGTSQQAVLYQRLEYCFDILCGGKQRT